LRGYQTPIYEASFLKFHLFIWSVPWPPPSIGPNTSNSLVDTVKSRTSTVTNSLAFVHSQPLPSSSLRTETVKQLYVLGRQSSSQTQGLSPSTSIRSPEDSTLVPKTPLDIRLIPNQLQHSQTVNWQSYKAKKFDKQDIPFPPASLGDFSESRTPQTSFTSAAFASKSGSISNFSGSSPKSLDCSPLGSAGILSPISESDNRLVNIP